MHIFFFRSFLSLVLLCLFVVFLFQFLAVLSLLVIFWTFLLLFTIDLWLCDQFVVSFCISVTLYPFVFSSLWSIRLFLIIFNLCFVAVGGCFDFFGFFRFSLLFFVFLVVCFSLRLLHRADVVTLCCYFVSFSCGFESFSCSFVSLYSYLGFFLILDRLSLVILLLFYFSYCLWLF